MVCFLIVSCKECFLAYILAESIVWSEQDRQRSAYFSMPNRLKWSSALRPDGWKPLLSTVCGHTSFSLLADIWRRERTRELNVWGEVAECPTDKPYQSSGVGGCGFKVWCWLWECCTSGLVHGLAPFGERRFGYHCLVPLSYFSFTLLNVWLCWTIFAVSVENILDSGKKMPRIMSISFHHCLGNLWEWAKAGTGCFAEGGVPA